ncbi:MAG: hypothetical protein JXD23_00290 [Spirochaetales bacterium]|nr:hypothetical protein [Spirochaetales bacterium]
MYPYFLAEFLFSFISGVAFALLAFFFQKNRSALDFAAYFVVLFLFIWAGGVWIRPFGPALLGVSFIRFLIVGLVATLFILALAPNRRDRFFPRRVRREMLGNSREKGTQPGARLPLLTGIIIAVFIALIILWYAVITE